MPVARCSGRTNSEPTSVQPVKSLTPIRTSMSKRRLTTAGGLRFGDDAEVEERRRLADGRLHAGAADERAARDVLEREEIALRRRRRDVRREALLGQRQLLGQRLVVEHEAGEAGAGDFAQLLESLQSPADPRRARHSWSAHERRLFTSNAPRSTRGEHQERKLGALGEARDQRELLVAVQAAAAGAERVDVRAAGRGEVVALAHAAAGAELQIEAEHRAGLARPVASSCAARR